MIKDIEDTLINKILVATELIRQLKKQLLEMEQYIHKLQEEHNAKIP